MERCSSIASCILASEQLRRYTLQLVNRSQRFQAEALFGLQLNLAPICSGLLTASLHACGELRVNCACKEYSCICLPAAWSWGPSCCGTT